MKIFTAFKQSIVKFALFVPITAFSLHIQAQSSSKLNVDNNSSQILSVKLVSFTAELTNNKGDLKWATASETNLSHFVIERSTDGINFNDAGVFFAYGNATDKTNYSFSDNLNTIQSGVVYYRLYSAGNNGKGQYSDTRIIRTGK
jgi:hypothetical protein